MQGKLLHSVTGEEGGVIYVQVWTRCAETVIKKKSWSETLYSSFVFPDIYTYAIGLQRYVLKPKFHAQLRL